MVCRAWPVLFYRGLCTVTQGPISTLQRVCCAAPLVLCVSCRTAWCCVPHYTVCALLHRTCGQSGVGSGASAMHYLTTWVQCVAQLLQCAASLLVGSGQWSSYFAPPRCLGEVGCETPATLFHSAWGQWKVELPSCRATLHGGKEKCNSCNTLPHCLGAVGTGTRATHSLTAWGRRAVQLLQCTLSLPRGSSQWNSCNTLPYCPGAVGSGTRAAQCHTA